MAWFSPDGLSWAGVPHDETVFGGTDSQAMWSVVAGSSGLVAVGHEPSASGSDAAVWTSPDGSTWSRVPHDQEVCGGTLMESVVAGARGWSPSDLTCWVVITVILMRRCGTGRPTLSPELTPTRHPSPHSRNPTSEGKERLRATPMRPPSPGPALPHQCSRVDPTGCRLTLPLEGATRPPCAPRKAP